MNKLTRWPLVFGLAAMVVFVAGCGGGGSVGGTDNSSGTKDVDLIVQRVLPTNGQEVASDLVDVGGVVEVKFSAPLAAGTVLDSNNQFNGLTSELNILDSAFQRVPGTPTINYDTGRGNVLTFVPAGGVLPNGQYTVTCSRAIKSRDGKVLNNGLFDTRSSFTVGPDTYKPVIRTTFPVNAQKEVPKDSQIVIIFNESLDPATVTNASISVMDGGQNPPVAVPGVLTTSRDNFEVVFTPDPNTLLPPNSTIVVTVTGGASGVADVVGNTFEDPVTGSPSWQFQFETVTEPPPPNNPLPFDLNTPDAGIYFGTGTSIGVLQENTYLGTYPDLTGWLTTNPVDRSITKIGRPGEIMVDPRGSPIDGHSWLYVVDEASDSITIVGTRDSKIVDRWKQFSSPRGLALQFSGKTLYVTQFAQDALSAVDISRVTVGTPRLDDIGKHLTDADQRVDVTVGRGPTGAGYSLAAPLVFVANKLEHSCSIVNASTATLQTTFAIGSSPEDVATTFNYPGVGYFAFVTCYGTGTGEDGSVSVYWNRPNGLQADITGFKGPRSIIFDYGASAWVANSGSNTTAKLTLRFQGGGFFATILPTITATAKVGDNPTGVTVEPWFFLATGGAVPPQAVITAAPGSGELTFLDATQPSRPTVTLKVPGVREVAAYLDH